MSWSLLVPFYGIKIGKMTKTCGAAQKYAPTEEMSKWVTGSIIMQICLCWADLIVPVKFLANHWQIIKDEEVHRQGVQHSRCHRMKRGQAVLQTESANSPRTVPPSWHWELFAAVCLPETRKWDDWMQVQNWGGWGPGTWNPISCAACLFVSSTRVTFCHFCNPSPPPLSQPPDQMNPLLASEIFTATSFETNFEHNLLWSTPNCSKAKTPSSLWTFEHLCHIQIYSEASIVLGLLASPEWCPFVADPVPLNPTDGQAEQPSGFLRSSSVRAADSSQTKETQPHGIRRTLHTQHVLFLVSECLPVFFGTIHGSCPVPCCCPSSCLSFPPRHLDIHELNKEKTRTPFHVETRLVCSCHLFPFHEPFQMSSDLLSPSTDVQIRRLFPSILYSPWRDKFGMKEMVQKLVTPRTARDLVQPCKTKEVASTCLFHHCGNHTSHLWTCDQNSGTQWRWNTSDSPLTC